MKIGQTIRILRTAKQVSQGALASSLEVTAGYLSLIEQDKREPSLSFLKRVGEYFELPVGFLLLEETGTHRANPEHKRLLDEIRRAMLDYILYRPNTEQHRKRKRNGK